MKKWQWQLPIVRHAECPPGYLYAFADEVTSHNAFGKPDTLQAGIYVHLNDRRSDDEIRQLAAPMLKSLSKGTAWYLHDQN